MYGGSLVRGAERNMQSRPDELHRCRHAVGDRRERPRLCQRVSHPCGTAADISIDFITLRRDNLTTTRSWSDTLPGSDGSAPSTGEFGPWSTKGRRFPSVGPRLRSMSAWGGVDPPRKATLRGGLPMVLSWGRPHSS